jgi:hypothetical protein
MGAGEEVYRVFVGRQDGKRPHGRPRRRWRVLLQCMFKKWDGEAWTGLIWLRIRTGGESL